MAGIALDEGGQDRYVSSLSSSDWNERVCSIWNCRSFSFLLSSQLCLCFQLPWSVDVYTWASNQLLYLRSYTLLEHVPTHRMNSYQRFLTRKKNQLESPIFTSLKLVETWHVHPCGFRVWHSPGLKTKKCRPCLQQNYNAREPRIAFPSTYSTFHITSSHPQDISSQKKKRTLSSSN